MAPIIAPTPPAFDFQRDTFAYRNELVWDYQWDDASGRMVTRRVAPPPSYAHHCFVMVRAVRQFLYHARFAPDLAPLPGDALRKCIREVMRRSPRRVSPEEARIVIPGFAGLRALSQAHEADLKVCSGGTWQSYCLRSHWRMILPFPRAHQERQARSLVDAIRAGRSPIVHVARFPSLTINHGVLLFAVEETVAGMRFSSYDPNLPAAPSTLTYLRPTRTFEMTRNHYFAGGRVDGFEIYRNWLF